MMRAKKVFEIKRSGDDPLATMRVGANVVFPAWESVQRGISDTERFCFPPHSELVDAVNRLTEVFPDPRKALCVTLKTIRMFDDVWSDLRRMINENPVVDKFETHRKGIVTNASVINRVALVRITTKPSRDDMGFDEVFYVFATDKIQDDK